MKIKSTVNFKNKTTLVLSWTKMKIQFKVKYKVNCKWNSKCKWKWISPWLSAATTIMVRALTSHSEDHGVEAVLKQAASKKSCSGETTSTRICRGERWNNCAEDEFRSNRKTAKVYQNWAKRICPIRIWWYNLRQHSRILPEVLCWPNRLRYGLGHLSWRMWAFL